MEMEDSLEEHLKQLEEELLQPHVRNSPEAMAKLLADEFVEFGSSGRIYNKVQTLKALGPESTARYSLSDFRAVSLALGVALTTYRVARFTPFNGQTSISLRSSIWKKKDGRWQIVFHQGTPSE